MNVPFFNYKKYCKDLNYIELLNEVLQSGYLIGGPFVDELENLIVKFTGVKNCITVGNATDAMEIIFEYLNLPISTNVIVPAHTMLATASAAKSANLNPIPLDVNERSLMIEVEDLERINLKNVSAIMITQLNGIVANMDPIKSFCESKKIALIEDSAQGIGAFNGNKHSGSWGVGGCISFYPAKVVGGLGDGGAIITNDDELANFARSFRDHGRGDSLEAINWGRNSRLDSINARVILERMKKVDKLINKRRKLADIYYEYLNKLEEKGFITLPQKYSTNSKSLSTFQNFEIQASSRNKLISYLKKNNISTIKQWGGFSIAHFSKLGFDINNYPLTKKLFDKLLLLPLNHLMNEMEIRYICETIKSFYLV